LSWNQQKAGHLLSGADDSKICIWDVESKQMSGGTVKPYQEMLHHKRAVNDVSWHHFKPEFFGSVSEDREVCLWDTREKTTSPVFHLIGHQSEIFSIDFNPFNEYLFLTGSADKTIGLWDLRNLSKKLHSFESHTDNVIPPILNKISGGQS
jgi:histone-binding protein RBBP4